MSDAKFDTMAAVQTLREVGVADRQAEAMVRLVSESQRNLATKDDLRLLEMKMDARFTLLETKMNDGFKLSETRMNDGFKLVRSEIPSRVATLVAAVSATLAALGTLIRTLFF